MKKCKRVLGTFLAAVLLLGTTPVYALEKSLWPDYYSVESEYTKVQQDIDLYYLYNETFEAYESDGYYSISGGTPFSVTNRADSGYVFVYYEAYTRQDESLVVPVGDGGPEMRDFQGEYICYNDGLTQQYYLNQNGGWSLMEGIMDVSSVGVDEPENYRNEWAGKMLGPGESVIFTLPDNGTDTIYLLWVWYNDPATGDYKWQYSEFKNEKSGTTNPVEPNKSVETVSSGNSADGLNGKSGKWADFNEDVYDTVTFISTVKNAHVNGFEWPSSGTILLKTSGSRWSLTDDDTPNCKGMVIPAGLVVDIYKYYQSAGMTEPVYELLGHFDTTDGNAYTISADTNTSTSSNEKLWGDVLKNYTPGTPSGSYSNNYTDVPPDKWCYNPIMTLTEGGLLNGYGGGLFGPDDPLTKGQVEIVNIRLIGNSPSGYGKDSNVASRAYAAILYIDRLNASNGTSERVYLTEHEKSLVGDAGGMTFPHPVNGRTVMWRGVYDSWRASLNTGKTIDYISSIDELPDADNIHRWIDENWEEMADILHTNAPTVGGKPDNRTVKEKTVDVCEADICLAYNLGMIGGVDSKGTFDPYGTLTRGQLAQMLYNMGWTYGGCCSYTAERIEQMKETNKQYEELGLEPPYEIPDEYK